MTYKETFDSFVVSAAHKIPVIVAKSILTKHGPNRILFYGPSGIGKIHLFQALAHAAKTAWPAVSCNTFTSDMFVERYNRSLQESRVNDVLDQCRFRTWFLRKIRIRDITGGGDGSAFGAR